MAGRVKPTAKQRHSAETERVGFPTRFEVYRVSFDPTYGSEIRKTRPCLIISPQELNESLATVIIAPMTSVPRSYPSRVNVTFQGTAGQVALDQMRAIDKQRLAKRLGTITPKEADRVISTLLELFA